MSNVVNDVLIEAINDEYKARALYSKVIEKFGEVRPFINIVEAEKTHIQALLPLFEKYSIEVPKDDWDSRVEVPESLIKACEVGVKAEIENAQMYTRLLAATNEYPDVQMVLRQLQRASQENHLPAFERCAQGGGGQGGGGRGQHRGNN